MPAFIHFAIAVACFVTSASARADYEPLLHGREPSRSTGVQRAHVMTDGVAARDGTYWKTHRSARFADLRASVVYDLGSPERVRAAYLHGDNDDVYRIEGSLDGRSFERLWDAMPVDHPGVQPRSIETLDATLRYVRIRPLRGDGHFAVSEVGLWAGRGGPLPRPAAAGAISLNDRLRDRTVVFGAGLLALLFVPARPRRWLLFAGLFAAGIGTARFLEGVWQAFPADAREVSLIRGVIGFVGAVAVARELLSPPRWPGSVAICRSVLGLCAVIGVFAFYNLGHPQFWNAQQGKWTYSHTLDLRQYYPTAKYFRELSYFRIYDADLAAYAEDLPAAAVRDVQDQRVRDLHTFDKFRIGDRASEIAAARARFSDARWAEYKRDAAWFRESMGERTYFESFLDFGGNATPVWMTVAHVLFSLVPPSDAAFTWMGAIDLVLLLAAFVAIQRTFGWGAMLVSVLVFGANDFVMYGTNWSGATLRHDWLAFLGIGVCALGRERWVQAGAWLGLATMIRAFPALALVGVGLPALLRTVEQTLRDRRFPRPAELWSREQPTVRVAAGALGAALITAAASMLVLGPAAWSEWWAKVAEIESQPHAACVALRNLIAGTYDQARVLAARWPVYAGSIALYCGAVALLCRNAAPERAAVLGLCLVPVVLYPANYYLHLVYLLPLAAAARGGVRAPEHRVRDAWVWTILLLMCAVQYGTTLEPDIELHFYFSTATLFATLTAMLGVLLAHDPDVRAWLSKPRVA